MADQVVEEVAAVIPVEHVELRLMAAELADGVQGQGGRANKHGVVGKGLELQRTRGGAVSSPPVPALLHPAAFLLAFSSRTSPRVAFLPPIAAAPPGL